MPVWEAFTALSAARQGGFGPQPIAVSEMLAWAQAFEVDDVPEFIRLLQVLDGEYLSQWKKTSTSASPPGKPKPSTP